MIKQVLTTSLVSLGVGYLCNLVQSAGETHYLTSFLQQNLITLLVALLAINSATMGIVLTKIRDLIDKAGGGAECFNDTKAQMLLSIKEQIALIVIAASLLTVGGSALVVANEEMQSAFAISLTAIFVYSMLNLYDSAKSVLIIIDYE
tara:strand:- start:998 stop:1441 length:444 start_codon:yes stop_codon:yes gene_type:complete